MNVAGAETVPLEAGPLFERERELGTIMGLLRDAGESRGRLLLIEAPAGIGKSALAERAAALGVGEGFLVLRAAGRELERGLGWGVARSLFESWLFTRPSGDREELLRGPAAPSRVLFEPDAGPIAPGAEQVGFGILHGLYWLAVRIAEHQPLLLVLDDAHWADEPSLRFVLYLLGRLREQPIAVLVAARPEAGEGGLLERLHGDSAGTVLEPAPLGEAAVAALVQRRFAAADAQLCRRCFELTRGNPLHVRELVSAIVFDTPEGGAADLDAGAERAARSLSRSVLRRLRALPPDAHALARAVAVFDRGVPLHQAAALADQRPHAALAAADALVRADILAAGDPLGFVHPLLRAAVYEALSGHDRALTHRRAAAVLAADGAPAEQIGSHLLQAAPAGDEDAVAGLRAAAHAALAHGVPVAAIGYLDRALREPPSAGARADVLAELGQAELAAGRREAADHLDAAIALMVDPRRRAEVRLERGRALHDFGRPDAACTEFERGAAELGPDGGELALTLESWYLTSAVLVPERAPDAHRRVDAIVARVGGAATPAERVLMSKALIMRLYAGGTRAELVPLALRLFADGQLIEEGGIQSQAAAHVAGALSYCDEYEAAEDVLGRTLVYASRRGLVTWVGAAAQLRSRMRLWTGPLADAIDDARRAFEIFAHGLQMYLPATAYCLARGLIEHDEPDEAAAVLALIDERPPATGGFAGWWQEAHGRLAAHRGDHERALEAFLAAGRHVAEMQVTNPAMFHWRSEAGLAALRLGDRDLARRLIDEELDLAERFGAPRAVAVARRAAGMLARGEDAVAEHRAAVDLLRRCDARVELALALAELGGAVRRAGRPTEARTTLREAIELADAVDARAVARRAREELTLAGGRGAPRRDAGRELTPSERRVAELAAAGRTNREIANELFVTVKAVEWHLGNAYRKLGVRGRGELADAL
jgi:DNA-binding CsgD family transcriptional regulator